MTTPFLAADIEHDEGRKHAAYRDTVGIWTVGVGHAHVAPGTVWNDAQIDAARDRDIALAIHELDRHLPWWRGLNDARQDVLANMTFNMGMATLLKFGLALRATEAEGWQTASDQMLASKWARQVGKRANRLAHQMLTGTRIAP